MSTVPFLAQFATLKNDFGTGYYVDFLPCGLPFCSDKYIEEFD